MMITVGSMKVDLTAEYYREKQPDSRNCESGCLFLAVKSFFVVSLSEIINCLDRIFVSVFGYANE